jgi:hypothetical protein
LPMGDLCLMAPVLIQAQVASSSVNICDDMLSLQRVIGTVEYR